MLDKLTNGSYNTLVNSQTGASKHDKEGERKMIKLEKLKEHNELRAKCREIAEKANDSTVWDEYFDACSIEQMKAFIGKYK